MASIDALILADMNQTEAPKRMRVRKARKPKADAKPKVNDKSKQPKRTRTNKKAAAPKSNKPTDTKEKWDPYEHVTNTIVEALEAGDVNLFTNPWVKSGMPRNAFTGRPYNGINVLLLWSAMLGQDTWDWPLFCTWNQAKQMNGEDKEITGWVREGEGKQRTSVVFWKQRKFKAKNEDTGEEEERTVPLIRVYGVYNVAQIEDSGDKKLAARILKHVPNHEWLDKPKERNDFLDAWIQRVCEEMDLPITKTGERACFIPSRDEIHIPKLARFRSTSDYYSVCFHELVHASGAVERLKRDMKGRFGTDEYAFEELVAELGAAFLCADHNVDGSMQHTEYIASWVKRMKDDKYAVFTAAKLAKQAVEYLHKMAGTDNTEE